MSLNVVQAPTQPNLTVTRTPNQPTLSPNVTRTPVQPALPPRVNTEPVQPTLSPTIQNKPAQPQISSIGTATNQQPYTAKMTLAEFGQTIKQKYPEYADRGDEEIAHATLIKYPQYQETIYTPSTKTDEGEKGLKGFALGVTKGGIKLAKNVVEGGSYLLGLHNAVKPAIDALVPNENLEAKGTAESIGKAAENIAEFFLPAGLIGKAGKAIEAGASALKLGSKATTAIKLAGKVGLGASEAGGITALQGGNKKEIKTAAVLGGGFTVVGKAIESVLNKLPTTAWTTILKRTPTEAMKNPNLPAQAAKTGLAGISRDSILQKAKSAIQSIEVSLDDVLSTSKGKINTAKVVGYLGDLRDSYAMIPGESSSVKIIDDIAREMFGPFKKGQSMTLLQANELKRKIYEVNAKSYNKGTLEIPAKSEAQKMIAAGLKREIERIVPEAKTLNERQAVYIKIRKALDKAIPRTTGKGIAGTGVGMYDLLLGGIGSGAGALSGNPFLGLGLVALKKTAESPAVLSSASKLLEHFNTLSPTKKLLFYQAIKGLTIKTGTSISAGEGP
jgi:hypothetical protein